MKPRQPDHTTYREWLYLEPDGELTAGERSSLRQHLAECPSCRDERREVAALDDVLTSARIEVSEDFQHELMAGMPAAGWEARSPRAWLGAVLAVLLLALGSALLIGRAGEEAISVVPTGALAAVWDLLATSALAGAGLLSASWKGLGWAIQDALGQSVWNILALGVIVLTLDLLLLRLLWRDRGAKVSVRDSKET